MLQYHETSCLNLSVVFNKYLANIYFADWVAMLIWLIRLRHEQWHTGWGNNKRIIICCGSSCDDVKRPQEVVILQQQLSATGITTQSTNMLSHTVTQVL